MGNKYANPPLVEAVCEFRLSEDSPWDLTLPGLFYEKVKDIFPEKRQVRAQEILVSQTPQGIGQKVQASDRIHFFSPDQKNWCRLALACFPSIACNHILHGMNISPLSKRHIGRCEMLPISKGSKE